MWTSRALTAQMTTRSISKRNNHLTKKFICPSSSFVTVPIFHKAVCRYRPTCRRAWMTFCQWREQEGYTWNTFWRSLDSVPRAWRRYSNPQERGICEFDRKAFTTEGIWMDPESHRFAGFYRLTPRMHSSSPRTILLQNRGNGECDMLPLRGR